jgi:hypothetical protein
MEALELAFAASFIVPASLSSSPTQQTQHAAVSATAPSAQIRTFGDTPAALVCRLEAEFPMLKSAREA